MATHDLTDQQKAWFRSLREGLERETGRSLAEWVAIAKTCPEAKTKARLGWMKAAHGLGQNRAMLVINTAFPPEPGWSTPDALEAALWTDAGTRTIFAAVRDAATALDGVKTGQRKGYTAFSRNYQFAAVRPKSGAVLLGLALPPGEDARLLPPAGRPLWSERLTAEMMLEDTAAVAALASLIEAAWTRS